MISRLFCIVALAAVFLPPLEASAQTKLLRFPDIHGDRVAFTYAGDIWTAPASGGREAAAHERTCGCEQNDLDCESGRPRHG